MAGRAEARLKQACLHLCCASHPRFSSALLPFLPLSRVCSAAPFGHSVPVRSSRSAHRHCAAALCLPPSLCLWCPSPAALPLFTPPSCDALRRVAPRSPSCARHSLTRTALARRCPRPAPPSPPAAALVAAARARGRDHGRHRVALHVPRQLGRPLRWAHVRSRPIAAAHFYAWCRPPLTAPSSRARLHSGGRSGRVAGQRAGHHHTTLPVHY